VIRSLLTQRVDLHRLGRNPVGGDVSIVETFSDLPALVQGKQEQVADKTGREVVSSAAVYLAADCPIDTSVDDWRITWDSRDWEVVAVAKEIDASTGRVHHHKAMIR
jgi:hypothetical protein